MIKGIEGARGWLAWIVVGAHIIVYTPLIYFPALSAAIPLGRWAVIVFIIISGFVIGHLLLVSRESYGRYIARRALRIFPAYLVALALGLLVAPLFVQLADAFPMQPPHPVHAASTATQGAEPALQLALHLSLLQGLVPNSLVPGAQYGFLPPAWSLSLEWQFYLLAPLFLHGLLRRPATTTAMVALLWLAFLAGLFGRYGTSPSFIAGAGWYFLLGLFSRIHFDVLPRFERYPGALMLLLAPPMFVAPELAPIAAWAGLLLYIRSDSLWGGLDGRLFGLLGARSYAVYIVHHPVLVLSVWSAWNLLDLSTAAATLIAALSTVAGTAAAAEIVHRYVERPAIAFGKRLSHERVPGAHGW